MTAGENQAGGGAGEAVRGVGWGQGRVGGGGEAAQEGERMASRASRGRMRKCAADDYPVLSRSQTEPCDVH